MTVNQTRKIFYAATCVIWIIALIFLAMVIDFSRLFSKITIGLVVLAFINAMIAKGQNKSGLKWFLITFILGPFATILLILF